MLRILVSQYESATCLHTEVFSPRWQPHFHGNRVAVTIPAQSIYEVDGHDGNNVWSIKAPTCPAFHASHLLTRPEESRRRDIYELNVRATALLSELQLLVCH